MKKYNKNSSIFSIASIVLLFGLVFQVHSQVKVKKNSEEFQLGDGLSFDFNDGDYQFGIGGFIQGFYEYEKIEGLRPNQYMNAKNTYFTVSGNFKKEKLSFLVQNNFSNSRPLLDAWVAYSPIKQLKITMGQKQTFTNNREMTFYEDKLQFVDRGVFSTEFSRTGREFGIFLESEFGDDHFIIKPKIALTSGDGINSFGADSRDTDKGGWKYGGRIDFLPLGNFKSGNDGYIADLLHEEKLKILIGTAFSQNSGASDKVGEGHKNFTFYNNQGLAKLPNYQKVYQDIIVKYKGFSLLGEYVNASASNLKGSFLDIVATRPLYMTEISEYLVVGQAYNLQAGYVTKSGISVDFRYEKLNKEFDNASSLLLDQEAFSAGITKYFKGNDFKVQINGTSNSVDKINSSTNALTKEKTLGVQFMVQVVF